MSLKKSLTPRDQFAKSVEPSSKSPYGKIIIKYDVGFSNSLYIRGTGGNLSWTSGKPLKNSKADEWIWEPTGPVNQCEFKILINDVTYELGDNHKFTTGDVLHYTPRF